MGKKRNPKTGRFDKAAMAVQAPEADAIASADYVDWLAKEQEAQRHHRQDQIIQRFVDANAAEPEPSTPHQANSLREAMEEKVGPADVREAIFPTPSIPTVVIGVRRRRWVLPVLLAVGVVAGGLLGAAAKDRELRPTIHLLNRAVAAVSVRAHTSEGVAAAQRADIQKLQDFNERLLLDRGGAIQAMDQARDTDRAAAHDLRRARTALRYDQDVDRVSDRAKTWEALRAVEKAERRLNAQP